ncbi:MAG: hypothetical protein MMC33_002910 [Icmadophila ericetorum]|nr:hypothetical protein [Icmadophila ericetorum]
MAQPTQQYHPQTYVPPQQTYSNHQGPYMPPAKRPRLSPNPSPHLSPNIPDGSLPNQVFSSPYPALQMNGIPQQQRQYEPPPIPQPVGAMGPPSRPTDKPPDKPTDMNELADVLVGSGVDLKEEEAALYNRYNTPQQQQQPNSSNPIHYGTPYNGPILAPTSPYLNRGDVYSSNIPGNRSTFYGAGAFNQPVAAYRTPEEIAEEAEKAARKKRGERRQYHLNNPFLQAGIIQRRLQKHSHATQVIVPQGGLLTSNRSVGQSTSVAVAGPDRNEIITVLQGQDLLYHEAQPLVDILTLLSLAAQERLCVLVEDSAAIAKGRRKGTHGFVPSELAEIAIGNGPSKTAPVPSSPNGSMASPKTSFQKRPYSAVDGDSVPVLDQSKSPIETIQYPPQLVEALRKVIQGERAVEDERSAKRAKRMVNGILGNDTRAASTPGPDGVGSSGLLGERAPDVSKKGATKKEQKRQEEAKATEAQQHAATREAASMALGMKTLSWMRKPAASSGSGFPVASRATSSSQGQSSQANGSGTSGSAKGNASSNKKSFGDFREDAETGKGIQGRDLVAVLELEPKEHKTLARALSKPFMSK